MMAISGLQFPRIVAVLGLVWSVGRVVYAYGYTSAPKNRAAGTMFFLPAFLGTFVLTIVVALDLLNFI